MLLTSEVGEAEAEEGRVVKFIVAEVIRKYSKLVQDVLALKCTLITW
jgi:hypothetical protein